jgi:hypothetical protein
MPTNLSSATVVFRRKRNPPQSFIVEQAQDICQVFVWLCPKLVCGNGRPTRWMIRRVAWTQSLGEGDFSWKRSRMREELASLSELSELPGMSIYVTCHKYKMFFLNEMFTGIEMSLIA